MVERREDINTSSSDIDFTQEYNEVLTQLRDAPDSEAFLEPVNWKKLGLDDYPNIIKCPMDLKTIGKNVKANIYTKPEQFWADIDLIWYNCQLYNHESSEVYQQSIKMEGIAENLKESMFPSVSRKNLKRKFDFSDSHTDTDEENMSISKKVLLCQRISRLSPELLALVVRHIYSEEQQVIHHCGEHKFALDIEYMSDKSASTTSALTKRLLKLQLT